MRVSALVDRGAPISPFLRHLPEFFYDLSSPIGKFLQIYVSSSHLPRILAARAKVGVFPSPAPFVRELGGGAPRSRRRRARWSKGSAARQWTALQFGVLSLLPLSSSEIIQSLNESWVRTPLRLEQWRCAHAMLLDTSLSCREGGNPSLAAAAMWQLKFVV